MCVIVMQTCRCLICGDYSNFFSTFAGAGAAVVGGATNFTLTATIQFFFFVLFTFISFALLLLLFVHIIIVITIFVSVVYFSTNACTVYNIYTYNMCVCVCFGCLPSSESQSVNKVNSTVIFAIVFSTFSRCVLHNISCRE